MLRRACGVLALLLVASAACAQVSGEVSLRSDYRYRGLSLTDGRPALQAGVAYDGRQGHYAGLFASTVRHGRGPHTLWLPYLGHAWRFRSGLSLDLGAQYLHFAGGREYDYVELYTGLVSARASARLSYAPAYFGHSGALYGELAGTQPLSARLRLSAHLGALALARAGSRAGHWRTRYDLRLGLGWVAPAGSLELAWVAVTPGGDASGADELPWDARDRSGWELRVSRTW